MGSQVNRRIRPTASGSRDASTVADSEEDVHGLYDDLDVSSAAPFMRGSFALRVSDYGLLEQPEEPKWGRSREVSWLLGAIQLGDTRAPIGYRQLAEGLVRRPSVEAWVPGTAVYR